jgi:ABC-type lipoprotein release transport system permease subunit
MFAYFQSQILKTVALTISLSVYFSALLVAVVLLKAIPEIASLPLKNIGVETIVQKTGKIPDQMIGIVFPHANAPISDSEYSQLSSLEFIESADSLLFFWYFDEKYFKSVSGLKDLSDIETLVLTNSPKLLAEIGPNDAIITSELSERQNLSVGDPVEMGFMTFTVIDILVSYPSANIVASDIYIDFTSALELASSSQQLAALYGDLAETIGNVVLLKTDPSSLVDKEQAISVIDDSFLIFSEKSFDEEINDQLALVSTTGKTLLGILGLLLVIAFCLLLFYNLKTRESEIATLRKIGWKLSDLRFQFVTESAVILLVSLLLGNVIAFTSLYYLKNTKIQIELPWDITAKPHFLIEENAIDRIIETNLPVSFDPIIAMLTSVGMFVFFILISLAIFQRLKKIKPYDMVT